MPRNFKFDDLSPSGWPWTTFGLSSAANVDIDSRIRTYSDIAEVAAVKHLGMTLLEAHIPAGALDLRGPIAFTDDLNEIVLASLGGLSTLSPGRAIDRSQVGNGAWFLLEIASAFVPGAYGSI